MATNALGRRTLAPMRIVRGLPDLTFVFAWLAGTRAALIVAGLVAMALLPAGRQLDFIPGQPWLLMWAQWDAEHYISIAVHGYSAPEAPFSNVVFFPLYPWLIRLVALPFGIIGPLAESGAALTGLLISNVSLVIGLLYMRALVERDFGSAIAGRSVVYMLVFPTTLFLSSVYAEPLFLATAAASLYHARRGEFYRAGLAGALAALTRPFGFLLLVPLLVELATQRAPARAWPSLALVPAGLAMFFAVLWAQFGDPLTYLAAGEGWGRELHWPWEILSGYLRGPLTMFDWPYAWLDLASIAGLAWLTFVGWQLLPKSYAAYSTAGLLLALSSGIAWFSAARHALALFPLIIVIAVLAHRPTVHRTWLLVSAALALVFMARVAVGYWVT